ncbi:MAG: gliding motility-associated C-terminal domain-containing protein [Bacteroidetes bacterium]|nr:gliding motility-associated C-terminal domain-containing protein [Bacteroidota bacterium]
MKTLFRTIIFLMPLFAYAQNSMVGDGFGGRLWYTPHNYSVGSYSGYTVCGDSGQLLAWGRNNYSQLGNNSNKNSDIPVLCQGMNNVHFYTAGYLSAAIKKDNSGWIWGNGAKPFAEKVIENVIFTDAGMDIAVFIKNDGTVWSVGKNTYGSFGNGTSGNESKIPVKMDKITDAARVANCQWGTIVLLKDGTVMAAGKNTVGCIGADIPINGFAKTPVVIPGLKDIVDIKANTDAIVALDKNGYVYAWGGGGKGSLGNGSIVNSQTVNKIAGLKNIIAISGMNDGDHFLALDSLGTVFGWGTNNKGQVGSGIGTPVLFPVQVATNTADILAGENFSYIIKADNSLWASGYSQLGASIWMDLDNTMRYTFTRIEPNIAPMNLCSPKSIKPVYIRKEICPGDSALIGNKYEYKAGNYSFTLKDSKGYDSVVYATLAYLSASHGTITVSKCSRESVKYYSKTYSAPGKYLDTIANYKGCDSIVSIFISNYPDSQGKLESTICENRIFTLNSQNYSEPGTYFQYLQNYRGCDSVLTIELNVIQSSFGKQSVIICEGQSFSFNNHTYKNAGVYLDTFSNYRGCDSFVSTSVEVTAKPHAGFSMSNAAIAMYDTVYFRNESNDANKFTWDFGTNSEISNDMNPFHVYQISGKRNAMLIAENSATGCKDTMSRVVDVEDITWFEIPEIFTPNGDGLNDNYQIYFPPFYFNEIKIFNRWGEKIYEGPAGEPGWDGNFMGKPCQEGVYIYTLTLKNMVTQRKFFREGTIILMRPN